MDFSGERGHVVTDPNEALSIAFEEAYNWRVNALWSFSLLCNRFVLHRRSHLNWVMLSWDFFESNTRQKYSARKAPVLPCDPGEIACPRRFHVMCCCNP